MTRTYLREVDYIKGVAALSVIAIHVTSTYVPGSMTAFIWNQAMRYAVPLFIIISGLLLQHSHPEELSVPYPGFIKRRLGKIGMPYLVWTLIYMLYVRRHDLISLWIAKWQFILDFGKNLLLGAGYDHLYFVVIMLQLYALYPLLRSLLRRNAKSALLASFAITFYFQSANFLFRYHLYFLPGQGAPYYLILFPTWIFYFVLGMHAADNLAWWKKRLLAANRVALVSVWLASLTILLVESRLTNTYGSSIKPSVMLYCLASFLLIYAAASSLGSGSSRAATLLGWAGSQAFIIYLSHLLFLSQLKSPALAHRLGDPWHGSPGMAILFLSVTAISLIFAYLVSLTPLAPCLGGVHSRGAPAPCGSE